MPPSGGGEEKEPPLLLLLMADFKRWKEQRLSRADASRKGSVDEPIEEIVRLLNDRETFCTTSSCSGRVVVLEQPPAAGPAAVSPASDCSARSRSEADLRLGGTASSFLLLRHLFFPLWILMGL